MLPLVFVVQFLVSTTSNEITKKQDPVRVCVCDNADEEYVLH